MPSTRGGTRRGWWFGRAASGALLLAALALTPGLAGGVTVPLASDCLARPADHKTVVSGSRSGQFRDDRDNPGWTYDARSAKSSAFPFASLYPFSVGKTFAPPQLCWIGGKVVGRQSRDLTWNKMKKKYDGAGARVGSNEWYVIDGLRVKNVEDGVDPRGTEGRYPKDGDGFVIRNAYFKYIRDDCVENDDIAGGIIVDSLFDGCYTGVSEQPEPAQEPYSAPVGETLRLDHVLLRLQKMPGPYGTWDPSISGHGRLFKWYPQSNRLDIRDSIFLVEAKPWNGRADFPPGATASNVTIVWLGSGSFPGSVPAGVTVTRDIGVWDAAKATWLARHGCSSFGNCTKLVAPSPY